MKKLRMAALLLSLCLLAGCNKAVDMTPVWQTDLPESGVHMEVSNATLLSDEPVSYAPTREDADTKAWDSLPAVTVDGQPVLTFYGVTADDINFVYLEEIAFLYVDYDRTVPLPAIDYTLTENADSVSIKLDTAYSYEFTVKNDQGSDTFVVIARRSDVK